MYNIKFSIIIATYNRSKMVSRAIESALEQNGQTAEIIVVDDCSNDDTEFTVKKFRGVKYFRQPKNTGPGPARDRGIREAGGEFVIILDDDDEMNATALITVQNTILNSNGLNEYPVLQFSHTNGTVNDGMDFRIIRLKNYMLSELKGDFTPIISRKLYIENNLWYPDNRAGGEHLLWWKIADEFGIPTWSESIMTLHDDAGLRLVSTESQIERSKSHLELAYLTLNGFGERMKTISPPLYRSNLLALATYGLISGDVNSSKYARKQLFKNSQKLLAGVVLILEFLPKKVLIHLFRIYRKQHSRI